ncbi:hypothetical protein FF011L_18460 [Roseimaritima multifibrata]|uniref:Recombination-associated protein RdgC n=1 Tax=Roseimaritima multifibrata TaxID=1930274 RepID=A0A517MDY1_9BACT|nr:hypothetical protein [Roseimaritima multifibrata]QDS93091.1 hypothetical protein FF011L_18460 [Roseimaritima multifibrata]
MPFLGGSLAFERFSVTGFEAGSFGEEHLELLQQNAAGNVETASTENVHVGFLGGTHVFDQDFDLAKNLINEAVHCSVRIDTNQIPSAIRKAWLQMELNAISKDNPSGTPTKSQRKEAKEAVEQRCEVEAATGKYRKMQHFPMLWDYRQETLYFGGSTGNASGHCTDLLERVYELELRHITSGAIAQAWGSANDRYAEVDDVVPAIFVPTLPYSDVAWANEHSKVPDFLGNEFLLWLWWQQETETDTFTLADQSEITFMLAKTLSLECPRGESGKETISAESPVKLPEAMQAVRTGKLPRKSGLTIVRDGRQFDLVLQAESFGISGAKIHLEDDEEFEIDDRIDAIRTLSESIDLLFHLFCERRTGMQWGKDLGGMIQWLESAGKSNAKSAA